MHPAPAVWAIQSVRSNDRHGPITRCDNHRRKVGFAPQGVARNAGRAGKGCRPAAIGGFVTGLNNASVFLCARGIDWLSCPPPPSTPPHDPR
jgi:hypothetical protein